MRMEPRKGGGPIGARLQDDHKVGIGRQIGHEAANAEHQIIGGWIVGDAAIEPAVAAVLDGAGAELVLMHKEQEGRAAQGDLIGRHAEIARHVWLHTWTPRGEALPSVDVLGGKWVSRQPRKNTVALAVFPQATFMGYFQTGLAVIARVELIGLPAFGFRRLGLDGNKHGIG